MNIWLILGDQPQNFVVVLGDRRIMLCLSMNLPHCRVPICDFRLSVER